MRKDLPTLTGLSLGSLGFVTPRKRNHTVRENDTAQIVISRRGRPVCLPDNMDQNLCHCEVSPLLNLRSNPFFEQINNMGATAQQVCGLLREKSKKRPRNDRGLGSNQFSRRTSLNHPLPPPTWRGKMPSLRDGEGRGASIPRLKSGVNQMMSTSGQMGILKNILFILASCPQKGANVPLYIYEGGKFFPHPDPLPREGVNRSPSPQRGS